MTDQSEMKPVLELRIALTVQDFDRLVEFYAGGLGINPAEAWNNGQGRGVILELGRATLEIFNEQQAGTVDEIEAGRRVSGPVRLAIKVPAIEPVIQQLTARGAELEREPVITPWGSHNARLRAPDGMQLTLFQE
jgi:catechol 2,3-dioxygenase-like lactoylglutathione lyase family enzyme